MLYVRSDQPFGLFMPDYFLKHLACIKSAVFAGGITGEAAAHCMVKEM